MSRRNALTVLALLAGCGSASTSSSPTDAPPTLAATVNATPDLVFAPVPASILPGGTITFAFGAVAHNVFFDPAPGAPADIPGNNTSTTVARTFPSAGTYNYSCHIHPGMRGTIVVATTSSSNTMGGNYYP